MTPVFSRRLGDRLPLPAGFPVEAYDRVGDWLNVNTEQPPGTVWFTASSAWKGVAYRAKAAGEHAAGLVESLALGDMPGEPLRYEQDHALFMLAVTALSAIECCYFAAFCIGHVVEPTSIPLSDPKQLKLYPENVLDRLRKSSFAADALVATLAGVVDEPEYDQLKLFRDVLAHRGTPPRRAFLSASGPDIPSTIPANPKALAKAWDYSMAVTDFPRLNDWVAARLVVVIEAMDAFCSQRTRPAANP
jgi:hypothetical protein